MGFDAYFMIGDISLVTVFFFWGGLFFFFGCIDRWSDFHGFFPEAILSVRL